ncbi:DUF1772 domain-containing protein [Hoeflea prorocentri]|uniref:DUF1772 domain-containing protein n=1 Tax=Hoeflea prorocentri TaxID=1922333 RepID=A0A9X3ZIW7_9HYPH|nr:DUF1772 domain-containing protein [Hoeflea prorocentri]MCY6383352.1 DUF1772 domain-containing protein [Hoeflea prorocentri]MDA5401152.1 DUF1772 domain-containing protein [Hoeflea prorocentri]
MLDALVILDLTLMAMVFGYGMSASAVSYPAMMASSRETAVGYFKPFFHKSNHLQLGLSIAVLLVSLAVSYLSRNWWWFTGAVILQVSGPYTIIVLMPVNRRIMAEGADIHSDQMSDDLGRWGRLHLPRTLIAGAIFILFAYLAVVGGV